MHYQNCKMPKPQLHALLIGVAKNKYPTKELKGCENDLKAMKGCLELLASGHFDGIHIHQLLNEEATRQEVVNAFENHLIKRASSGDTAVFFFSGHGGQEQAPPELLRYEADGKLEGLVCYDSSRHGGQPKLIDKELRWLIYRLSQKGCEVISIFDCCHSGDNTRYELSPEHLARHMKEEDGPTARPWEDMLVSPDHPLKDLSVLAGKDLVDILPEGRHISFAACLDYEVAFEDPHKNIGYFTDALTSTLEEFKGSLSYLQLQREVRNRLRKSNFNQPQTPNIYSSNDNGVALMNNFLFGDRRDHPLYGNIHFDGQNWVIDLGGIHGLVAGEGEERIQIHVLTGSDAYELAYVSRVYVGHSELVWDCEEQEAYRKIKFPDTDPVDCYIALNGDARYKGYISGLMSYPLTFYLGGEQEGIDNLRREFKGFKNAYPEFRVEIVKEPSLSAYQILAQDNSYHLVKSPDQQAMVKEIKGYTIESAERICRRMLAICRWTFVKNLQNKELTWHEPFPIELILEEESGHTHFLTGKDALLELSHSASEFIKFRIRCVNKSEKQLHFSLLYLDQEFGIHTNFIKPNIVKLENKHSEFNYVSVDEGRWIKMRMPPHIKQLNWSEEVVFFKLIVSTQPFEVNLFTQDSLPAPTYDSPFRDISKGFMLTSREELGREWTTHLIECRLSNPFFNES